LPWNCRGAGVGAVPGDARAELRKDRRPSREKRSRRVRPSRRSYLYTGERAAPEAMMRLSKRHENLLKHTFIVYQQTSEFLENPIIVNRADGLYYWDLEGKRYFDAIGGIFVASLGHRHPRLHDAVRRQMDQITFAPPLHGISDVTLDFVEKIG